MNSGPVPLTSESAQPDGGGEAEQLSAWLDGELESHATDAMVAGLLRRPDLQRRYAGWCMVGDALRSREVLAGNSPDLCARISAALKDEPALLAPAALPGVSRFLVKRHLGSGIAVAAAAAVLVLVAVPQLRSAGGGADAPAIARSAPAAAGITDTVAVVGQVRGANRNPRLDPYIQAHRDFMGNGVMPAAAVYLRSGSEGER